MRFYYQSDKTLSEGDLSTDVILQKLEGLDYRGLKNLGNGLFEAEQVGRFLPEIIPDPAPRYGPLIRKERENRGLSREVLADVLFISDQHLKRVEDGTAFLGEFQIRMVASVLGLDLWFLQHGAKKEENSVEQVTVALQRLWQKVDDFQRLQEDLLRAVFGVSEENQFQPRRVQEEEEIGYQIYDTKGEDFLRDTAGEIIRYTSATEAYAAARQMESLSAMIASDLTLQQTALGKKIDRLIYHLDPWAYHNQVKDIAAQETATVRMVKENRIGALIDGITSFEITDKDWMILNDIIEDYNAISPDQNHLVRLADRTEDEIIIAYGNPVNLVNISLRNQPDIYAALNDAKMQVLGNIQIHVDTDSIDAVYSMRDKSVEVMPTLAESVDSLLQTNAFPDDEDSLRVERDDDMITIYDIETLDEDGMPQILMKSDVNGQIYYQADLDPERQKQAKDILRRESGVNHRLDEIVLAEEAEERRESQSVPEVSSDPLDIRK